MESREVSRRTKEREGDALRAWKKEEAQKRGDGKKEFYLKKGSSLVSLRINWVTDLTRHDRRAKGGDSAGQVRSFESRQEVVAQDGGEEAQKDWTAREEAHAGEEEKRMRYAGVVVISRNAKVYKDCYGKSGRKVEFLVAFDLEHRREFSEMGESARGSIVIPYST